MLVLVRLCLMPRMVVIMRPMLAGTRVGMGLFFTIMLVPVLMFVDMLVLMSMLVFVGMHRLPMLVRVGMHMLMGMGMKMGMLVFSFHCAPPG